MAEYLTTEEAIKILKIARSTLYEWIAQGKIKTYKVAGGRKNYFKQNEIEALFQPNTPPPAPGENSDQVA